jgi:GPH family glycoside/pentoside/hexuronide:cation symporter
MLYGFGLDAFGNDNFGSYQIESDSRQFYGGAPLEQFKGYRRFLYNLSTAGHALFDSLLLTFYANFFLPPREEKGMQAFVSDVNILGFLPILGLIMLFGRLVDMVADPTIASFSDRSKSKIGRRRFFMLIAALPLCVSTILVFYPPVRGDSWINAVYLAIMMGVFFWSYTTYVAPYLALIPELGHTEKERVGMTTVQALLAIVGAAIPMLGGPILIGTFVQTSTPTQSYQHMVVIISIVGFLLLTAAIFAVNEKKYSTAVESKVPLLESFLQTMNNKPFIIFLVANLCNWYVFNTLRSITIHIGKTLMHVNEEFLTINFAILFGSAGICFILILLLLKKVDKKQIFVAGLIAFAVLSLLISFTGMIPGVDPVIYAIVLYALFGFPVAVLLVIPNVFISELCDYDYTITGERKEAMYFGAHGFFQKLILGIAAAVFTFFFTTFGKDVANPLGVRLSTAACSVVAIIGMAFILGYPSEKVKQKIKG